MSKPIIKVENLSKRYRLGLKEQQADTLVGQFKNILQAPYRNYKRLRELSKFGHEDESVFWALKDVSFEVKEGEVLGIIGKNGAGKSTLLKILSQITEPTSGRVEIHGRVASLLEVGTGFHPELSGRENIYMNGTILGMTKREIDSKLDEIIDFSGVEKFIDTPVKFYSSGMKVRLGFSVAAHLDPEILIIDEVLAVGDYEFQQKCLGKMEDVSKNQGRTVLFVSHDLGAVKTLCPNTILLQKGMISRIGETSDVLDFYFKMSNEVKKDMSQVIFSGDGNNILNIKACKVNGVDFSIGNHSFTADKTLEIELHCFVKSQKEIRTTVGITTNQTRLLSFFDFENGQKANGNFTSKFEIPLKFFRPGNFSVGIGINEIRGSWIWSNDVFNFEILKDYKLMHKEAVGIFNLKNEIKTSRS